LIKQQQFFSKEDKLMRKLIGILGAIAVCTGGIAADEKEPTARKLTLYTDYLSVPVPVGDGSRGAHLIGFDVVVGDKSGKGVMYLDPNVNDYNAFGDITGHTEVAIRNVEVTLSQVDRDDSTKKGRRLFEITGDDMKARLFLVVAVEKEGPHRLLFAEKDGNVKHVFSLRDESKRK
jgi:hypothetical protein